MSDAMTLPLELIRLQGLMALTSGNADVRIGLVDGPVAIDHPDLAEATIVPLAGGGVCDRDDSGACSHGTFVAGILAARRGSSAPAICPGCTLLVRPVFGELAEGGSIPTATPDEVGRAIVDCVEAGARIVNLSAATRAPNTRVEAGLSQALDHVARRGALVAAAAGNQATLGSSSITRHAGVVTVVGYDAGRRPMRDTNLGASAGRRGVGAPGEGIVSLSSGGQLATRAGTSFATAFVSGAIALLWSLFPDADASRVKAALLGGPRRTSVAPPLLDAEAARAALASPGP
jgi:subtilisin family serine protease